MTSKELSKEVQRKLKDAWLGIDYPESELINPLNSLPLDSDDFHLYLSYLMMQPEYFPLICKEILGVEVYPMQGVVLQNLWRHRFPLLVGARGMSKCCPLNTLIITSTGIQQIGELIPEKIKQKQQLKNSDIKILGENGYHELDYSFYNGYSNNKKIITRYGYSIEGTLDHPIRVVDNGEIVWKELKDIKVKDKVAIQRNIKLDYNHNNLDPDIAYMIGAFVGDGCYSMKSSILGFTNMDVDCLIATNNGIKKAFNTHLVKVKNTAKKKYEWRVLGGKYIKDEFIKKFGCNLYSNTIDKKTPQCIWSAPKESIAAYLQGLFDTDGCSPTKTPIVEYSTKVYNLATDVQFLLLCLGIISRVVKHWNKKYKKYYYKVILGGSALRVFNNKVGFRIGYKQTLLDKHCSKISNENIDLIPRELCLEHLLELRKLSNDTIYHKRYTNAQIKDMSKSRLQSYDLSYDKFNKILNILSDSPSVLESDIYKNLRDIESKNYFYDTVTEIEDAYSETCDIHLKEDHSFISNGFISHNTFTIALYAILRALLIPDRKVIIAGSVFRQSKMVFEYMEGIYNKSKIFQSICHQYHRQPIHKGNDLWRMHIGSSQIMAVPIGTGESIRGLRANDLCVEEFAAHDRDVFETVLSGFVAVSSDPVAKLKQAAEKKMALEMGLDMSEYKDSFIPENQMILSGTAYYQFNHFYEYWKKWCQIIESSNVEKIINTEEKIDDNLQPADFCVMRIPVDLIPDGFMDKVQIARAKASLHSGNFQCEYESCFSADSAGFYKRSLIESCVCGKRSEVKVDGRELIYYPSLNGEAGKRYVLGVDPASEQDNFAMVLLEVTKNYRKIVYCWTINRKEQKQRVKDGILEDNDFYYYCSLKIRELMSTFNIERIALDSQGGGIGVIEALSRTRDGEKPIYEVIDPKKFKESDAMPGLHIVEMINFASSDWTGEANHGMRKDFEHKQLLFPAFDSLSLGFAEEVDKQSARRYDTMEDCVVELEELKNELASIIIVKTATGRERWDTPETKVSGVQKRRMRKDRYSALLMANNTARNMEGLKAPERQSTLGGFAVKMKDKDGGPDFIGPDYLTNKYKNLYD